MQKNYSRSKILDWYVVTGGPSSGKTTILEALKKIGYITYPEAARILIDKAKKKGKKLKEIRKSEAEFQKKVLKIKIEIEKSAPRNKTVFFDRAIPDSIAYYRICRLDTKAVLKFCQNKYRKIFFLEQLPIERDYARTENGGTIKKLDKFLEEGYKSLGYNISYIPIEPAEKRVKRILKEIN
ncbi:MAG: ATP-binding protein [Patescibacteria group bacterium]